MFSQLARVKQPDQTLIEAVVSDEDPLAQRQAALAQLRRACRSDLGRSTEPPFPTGCEVIDAALHGGLPRGHMVEAVGNVGRLSLALNVLAQATQRRELAVMIDGADALDPRSAEELGIDLRRLLWVRVKKGNDALRAADMVLSAGGVSLLVLYLVEQSDPQLAMRTALWTRLGQRTQRAKASVLICADKPLAQSFAVATLGVHNDGVRWQDAPGGRGQLSSRQARIEVLRSRLGAPGDSQPWCLRK